MQNQKIARAVEELYNISAGARVIACEDFRLFYVYYFGHYIQYAFSDFHHDMFKDIRDLTAGEIDELMWCMFRESAKTSFAKIYLSYLICYSKEKFIGVASKNKNNASKILFDVTLELQTNDKLISDFGEMYNEKRTSEEKKEKKVDSFKTTNSIQLNAYSVLESMRGALSGPNRLTFILFDDFETLKTSYSTQQTQTIIDVMNEARAGLQAGVGKTLYLGNYVSDKGSVQYFIDLLNNHPTGRVRKVPILNIANEPTWSQKYSVTGEKGKVSIDSLKSKYGEKVFQLEYMLEPNSVNPEGAYYTREIDAMKTEKRICKIPYEKDIEVNTWWDLGISDNMIVGFFQKIGLEERLIDYIDVTNMSLKEVIGLAKQKDYNYGRHFAPHDIQVRELSSGKSRLEIAREMGINFDITPNLPIMDGIDAVKDKLKYLYVDESCVTAINTLAKYRKNIRPTSIAPLHDWTSHIADMFRYWAVTDITTQRKTTGAFYNGGNEPERRGLDILTRN